MKKTLFIILLTLVFVNLKAQKLEKPVIDKITGDTTIRTSKEYIYYHGNYLTSAGEVVYYYIKKYKGEYDLLLNIKTINKTSVFSINKGSKVYFKLKDNTVVTLTSDTFDFSSGHVDTAGDFVYTTGSAAAIYNLPKGSIDKLLNSDIITLRIETSNGNSDYDIKVKKSDEFKKSLTLITEANGQK